MMYLEFVVGGVPVSNKSASPNLQGGGRRFQRKRGPSGRSQFCWEN